MHIEIDTEKKEEINEPNVSVFSVSKSVLIWRAVSLDFKTIFHAATKLEANMLNTNVSWRAL